MLEIKAKLKAARGVYRVKIGGQLLLPFEQRQKTRLRTALVSGEEVALLLPRGEVLRGGDLVTASDGRVIEVLAAPEKLLHVEGTDVNALARAAYHLGNRHVPVEVGGDYLRIAEDHVLEGMLRKLGMKISAIEAPFEPESGAYASEPAAAEPHHHHHHGHDHHHH